jgi:hypothetical protein
VQHPLRAVGGDVAEAVVVVFLVGAAQRLEVVEEIAREQADADAQLQDEDIVFELAVAGNAVLSPFWARSSSVCRLSCAFIGVSAFA